jgi:hypothetical protein
MGSFLWFMFGLWIGGTVGFLLFAWMQMSRESRGADVPWSKLDADGRTIGIGTAGIGSASRRRPGFRAGEAGC